MKTLTSKFYVLVIALSMLLATSCGKSDKKNPTIPGVTGPTLTFDQVTGSILVSMVFNFSLDGGLRISPIPKFPHSYIEVGPDLQSDGTLVAINLDVLEILNADPNVFDPQTLPGGRPLPGLSTGRLPGFAVTLPRLKNVSFYVGKKIFGFFMPAPLMNKVKNVIGNVRFRAGGKRVGNIALVGGDENGENGGFLLMLDLDAATRKKLKKFAETNR